MAKKIVIDAGHGGDDPGAIGNGITEKDKTLEISKYMYDLLKNAGVDVSITRNTDETLNPTDRVNRILEPFGNSSDVIVISNHINAGGGDGAEVIYALRNNSKLSDLITEQFKNKGQNVRKAYQRRLPSDTSKDYYFIHRNTQNTEPIIVEYGFLDSTSDDVNQLKNNWKSLTEGVVSAVLTYIGKNTGDYYIVKSGDTLYSIARMFNTDVNKIKEINNLYSNILSIGQKLLIPTVESKQDIDTYTVKGGDTLYSIAKRFNISINDLMKKNNLNSTMLSLNQKLIIPKENDNSNEYVVKSGDTLYGLSSKYNTSVSELMKYNNLTSNILSIGQILKIPTSNAKTYTVKSGDTLYNIAKNNNVTVDYIKNKNNLTSNILSIGQILQL